MDNDIKFDPETMAVGRTCKTCWSNGHRQTMRYKSNKLCVRCRVQANAKYYNNNKGGTENA